MRKAIGIASFAALVGPVLSAPAALAAPGDDSRKYRVYVFTRVSADVPVQRRGQGDQGPRQGQRVHRPVQRRPDTFTEENLERFRAVVFLTTLGRRPQRPPAGRVRGVLPRRRRLRRRSTPPSRPSPTGVPHRRPRRPGDRPHRQPRRAPSRSPTASTRRRRACPSTGTGPRPWYNFDRQRPGLLPRAGDGRRGPVRRAPDGTYTAARWASTTRSPGARTTRAAGRSTPALGGTPASFVDRLTCARTWAARSGGRPA